MILHYKKKKKLKLLDRNNCSKRYRYFAKNTNENIRRMAAMIPPTIIPMVDAGGFSVVCGFIGEMQVPLTGKISLSFPQDDTACICKRLSWIIK